jgi:DNA-binding CsgD family transcriptional regulator
VSPSSASDWVRLCLDDDVIPYWKLAKVGRACRIEDFTTYADFSRRPIYERFLEPLKITQLTVMTLRMRNGAVACIGLGRERERFSDSEINELNQLAPILSNAHSLTEKLSLYHLGKKSFIQGLDWVRFEKVIVACTGVVMESTSDAGRWIREFYGPLTRYSCTLPFQLWDTAKWSAGRLHSKVLASKERGDEDQLTLRMIAMAGGELALLLERKTRIDSVAVRKALKLGRVECTILQLLLEHEGRSIPEIALATCSNRHTLSKQVKNIRKKLGVGSRAEVRQAVHDRLTQLVEAAR